MPMRIARPRSAPPSPSASRRWISTAARTAAGAEVKTRKNASPSVPNSCPQALATAARITTRRASSTGANSSGPRAFSRRVEPSMSVKAKVTVPVGRSPMADILHAGGAGPQSAGRFDETQGAPPRVGALVPKLVEPAVEERVRGTLVHHDLVRHPGVVDRPSKLRELLGGNARVGTPEHAEDRAAVVPGPPRPG